MKNKDINFFITHADIPFVQDVFKKVIENHSKIKVKGALIRTKKKIYFDKIHILKEKLNCDQFEEEKLYNINNFNNDDEYSKWILDEKIILSFYEGEIFYLDAIERFSSITMPIRDIKEMYYLQLNYFLNYFIKNNINHLS